MAQPTVQSLRDQLDFEQKARFEVLMERRQKKLGTATVLSLPLLGTFGIEQFYLGNVAAGILRLIFSVTLIPTFSALFDIMTGDLKRQVEHANVRIARRLVQEVIATTPKAEPIPSSPAAMAAAEALLTPTATGAEAMATAAVVTAVSEAAATASAPVETPASATSAPESTASEVSQTVEVATPTESVVAEHDATVVATPTETAATESVAVADTSPTESVVAEHDATVVATSAEVTEAPPPGTVASTMVTEPPAPATPIEATAVATATTEEHAASTTATFTAETTTSTWQAGMDQPKTETGTASAHFESSAVTEVGHSSVTESTVIPSSSMPDTQPLEDVESAAPTTDEPATSTLAADGVLLFVEDPDAATIEQVQTAAATTPTETVVAASAETTRVSTEQTSIQEVDHAEHEHFHEGKLVAQTSQTTHLSGEVNTLLADQTQETLLAATESQGAPAGWVDMSVLHDLAAPVATDPPVVPVGNDTPSGTNGGSGTTNVPGGGVDSGPTNVPGAGIGTGTSNVPGGGIDPTPPPSAPTEPTHGRPGGPDSPIPE